MSVSGVKDWVCDFLHSSCTTQPRYNFLKPIYSTVCFFQKRICISASKTNMDKINHIDGTKSKCDFTDYFTDVFGKVCTTSCNITQVVPSNITQVVPSKSHASDNSCKITDYFSVWLNQTKKGIFPQARCEPITSEGNWYLNWRDVGDSAKLWLSELYQKCCCLVDRVYQHKMWLREKVSIEAEKSGPEEWIRNWMQQNLGIQWPRNISFLQFALFFCTIGGIGLYVLLRARRSVKPKTQPSSLKLQDINAEFVQMLLDVFEKYKSDYENLQRELAETHRESSKTNKDLSRQIRDLQLQLEVVAQCFAKQEAESQECEEHKHPLSARKQRQETEKESATASQHEHHQKKEGYQQNIQDGSDRLQTEDEACVKQSAAINKANCNQETEQAESTLQEHPHVIKSLEIIQTVFKHVQELEQQIEEFSGSEEDTTFLHLTELLIRYVLKLDTVDSNGNFIIRKRRREVLEYIYDCQSILKSKVTH